jgi:NhaA family Na+:H+ antiporter
VLFDHGEVATDARKAVDRLDQADEPERVGLLGDLEELVVGSESLSDRIDGALRPWVSYAVLPLFALAVAGTPVSAEALATAIAHPAALGVIAGLLVGKPLGVLGGCWLAVRLGMTRLPPELSWRQLGGVSILAGIGFTVSLFIAKRAFTGDDLEAAKLAILGSSFIAAVVGALILMRTSRPTPTT